MRTSNFTLRDAFLASIFSIPAAMRASRFSGVFFRCLSLGIRPTRAMARGNYLAEYPSGNPCTAVVSDCRRTSRRAGGSFSLSRRKQFEIFDNYLPVGGFAQYFGPALRVVRYFRIRLD